MRVIKNLLSPREVMWLSGGEWACSFDNSTGFIHQEMGFLPPWPEANTNCIKISNTRQAHWKILPRKASLSSDQSRQRQGRSCGSTALSDAVRSFKHYHRTDWDLNVNRRTFQLVQRPHFIQLNSRQARWKPWWRKWPSPSPLASITVGHSLWGKW